MTEENEKKRQILLSKKTLLEENKKMLEKPLYYGLYSLAAKDEKTRLRRDTLFSNIAVQLKEIDKQLNDLK